MGEHGGRDSQQTGNGQPRARGRDLLPELHAALLIWWEPGGRERVRRPLVNLFTARRLSPFMEVPWRPYL